MKLYKAKIWKLSNHVSIVFLFRFAEYHATKMNYENKYIVSHKK